MKLRTYLLIGIVLCCMSSDLYSKTIKNTFTNKRQYITGFTDTGTIDFTLSGNDITAIVNPDLVIDSLIISDSDPPASPTATGTTGQITWDATHIYVCIATDTWKRTLIETWSVAAFNIVLDDGTSKILLDDGTSALLGR